MLSQRDSNCMAFGLIIGLAVAAVTFIVGWANGRATGVHQAERIENDWWTYSAKVDVVTRWEEVHLSSDDG